MFKDAIAVAKLTLFSGEASMLTGGQLNAVDVFANVPQLDAISADVLNGGRACATGDQRQIFQPGHIVIQRVANQLMPVFAGTYMQMPGISGFTDVDTFQAIKDHGTRIIFQKQDVASFTQDHHRQPVAGCLLPGAE